jgi:hypothetical protein
LLFKKSQIFTSINGKVNVSVFFLRITPINNVIAVDCKQYVEMLAGNVLAPYSFIAVSTAVSFSYILMLLIVTFIAVKHEVTLKFICLPLSYPGLMRHKVHQKEFFKSYNLELHAFCTKKYVWKWRIMYFVMSSGRYFCCLLLARCTYIYSNNKIPYMNFSRAETFCRKQTIIIVNISEIM